MGSREPGRRNHFDPITDRQIARMMELVGHTGSVANQKPPKTTQDPVMRCKLHAIQITVSRAAVRN
jgi:hypothetical protein